MSVLTIYPTRRQALKAAHRAADTSLARLVRGPHRRPPFKVFGTHAKNDRWYTSLTEFRQNEQLHHDTHDVIIETDGHE